MGAQSTGAIYNNTAPVTVNFGSQTATATQTNVPVTVQIKDVQINPTVSYDASKTLTGNTNNSGTISS
jgi:hypothetical protein